MSLNPQVIIQSIDQPIREPAEGKGTHDLCVCVVGGGASGWEGGAHNNGQSE